MSSLQLVLGQGVYLWDGVKGFRIRLGLVVSWHDFLESLNTHQSIHTGEHNYICETFIQVNITTSVKHSYR